MSSGTAVGTGPRSVGGWVNATPGPPSRSYPAARSSTPSAPHGGPASRGPSRYCSATGLSPGSSTSSTSCPGAATGMKRAPPRSRSVRAAKPSTSVRKACAVPSSSANTPVIAILIIVRLPGEPPTSDDARRH